MRRPVGRRGRSRQPEPELTPRQHDVMAGLPAGLKNREIARDLGISVKTVEVHLQSAFRRLGVPKRTAAAAAYVRRFPPSHDNGDDRSEPSDGENPGENP